MEEKRDFAQIGRFIYGTHRLNFELALWMELMGKPLVTLAPGERIALAAEAAEADAMFARLAASDAVKAEFSALMQSLAWLDGQLGRIADLSAQEVAGCAAATASALGALPRFRAVLDELLGPGANG